MLAMSFFVLFRLNSYFITLIKFLNNGILILNATGEAMIISNIPHDPYGI